MAAIFPRTTNGPQPKPGVVPEHIMLQGKLEKHAGDLTEANAILSSRCDGAAPFTRVLFGIAVFGMTSVGCESSYRADRA
jgi:hypothetical protein